MSCARWKGHSRWVYGVAVTPDGKGAVSASYDRTLKVWDLETGSFIATFYCDAAALCCACADGRRIVAGDQGGRVYFFPWKSPEPRSQALPSIHCGAGTPACRVPSHRDAFCPAPDHKPLPQSHQQLTSNPDRLSVTVTCACPSAPSNRLDSIHPCERIAPKTPPRCVTNFRPLPATDTNQTHLRNTRKIRTPSPRSVTNAA